MTTQLSLYNGALRILKERRLASLTENREPRRLLDDAWGDGASQGSVRLCLELGQWTFATRTVLLDYSPSVDPAFGHRYAYDQPSDMVRPVGIFYDEYCQEPLLDYVDERRYWYASVEPIYIKYISNHTTYGGDPSLWSELFVKMVEARLALEIAGNLTQGERKVQLANAAWHDAMKMARSMDAMNKPTTFLPEGNWSKARRSTRSTGSLSQNSPNW